MYFQIKVTEGLRHQGVDQGRRGRHDEPGRRDLFKEIAVGYKAQANDGQPREGLKQFNWNVAKMNETVDGQDHHLTKVGPGDSGTRG